MISITLVMLFVVFCSCGFVAIFAYADEIVAKFVAKPKNKIKKKKNIKKKKRVRYEDSFGSMYNSRYYNF